MSVRDLPWLNSVWQHLTELKKSEQLPHAIIFNGLSGLGKFRLAEDFARAVLCLSPDEQGHACGSCHGCAMFDAGSHPDLHRLTIEENKKSISIEQVRSLIESFQEKSHQGDYRVALIYPADKMNHNSANALLKTLEEPGQNTLLMLVVDELHRLPPTIRSRCLLQTIAPVSPQEGVAWLAEHGHSDESETLEALTQTGYAPIKALQYIEQDLLFEQQKFYSELLAIADQKLDPVGVVSASEAPLKTRMIDWLYRLILDALRAQQTGNFSNATTDQKLLFERIKAIPSMRLSAWLDEIIDARKLFDSSSNISPDLILENLLVRWIAISRVSIHTS